MEQCTHRSLPNTLPHAGLLEDKEYDALHACVEVRMKQLELRQPHTPLVDPRRVLAESTLLADVPPKSVAALLRSCAPALINPKDEVALGRSTCLFVASGSMTLCGAGGVAVVSPNTLLGGLAAAAGLESDAACCAATLAMVVRIPASALQVLLVEPCLCVYMVCCL